MLNQKELNTLFSYNPYTGIVIRKTKPSGNTKIGGVVGTDNGRGYLKVMINQKGFFLHRVIWIMVYGYIGEQIGHINKLKKDNRLVNLRCVNNIENNRNKNMLKNNTSGVTGVYMRKGSKNWYASIRVDWKLINLGTYKNKLDAITARKSAELKYGFCEGHGT